MSLFARIRSCLLPGLLPTGTACGGVRVICDGLGNLYVVVSPKGLICFDAGWSARRVLQGFRRLGLNAQDVRAVFATHLDWDHCRCAGLYAGARLFAGAAELARRQAKGYPWTGLADGETLAVGGLTVRAIGTPGHTAGSTCYVAGDGLLFTGDALRLRNGLVAPFPACFNRDPSRVAASLRKLAALSGIRYVFTAHSGVSDRPDSAFRAWRTVS